MAFLGSGMDIAPDHRSSVTLTNIVMSDKLANEGNIQELQKHIFTAKVQDWVARDCRVRRSIILAEFLAKLAA